MARIIALDILKASHQHADALGSSGLAMLSAITCQWDSLGSTVSVCWSNSRLAERSGLSRNSIEVVRKRLMDTGWLIYTPDGRQSGHYIPKLPEYHAQTSAVECATGAQFTVQVLCIEGASTVQLSVQPLRSSLGSYIPMPVPEPVPEPNPNLAPVAFAQVAKAPKQKSESDILLEAHPFKISGPKRAHKPVVNELIKRLGSDKAGKFLASITDPLWPDRLMAAATRWIEPTSQIDYGKAPPINFGAM